MTVSVPSSRAAERWELYRLLGEPLRLRLLALAGEDELAVSELAELLAESQPTVSRQAAPLRQAGLLTVRRHGTWTLMRLADGAARDAVVADAVRTGREICRADGTLGRVGDLVRARERSTREFFARPKASASVGNTPAEIGAYLAALGALLPQRTLAVDAGTGEGRSLDVLAPLFRHVIALDRSAAQLSHCRDRVQQRGWRNVSVVEGEFDGPEVLGAVRERAGEGGGADVVLAARVLHHAPRPADAVRALASLVAPHGALVVIEYERHEDEALRDREADLWLGFDADELRRLAHGAGFTDVHVAKLASELCGHGPDRHLAWHALVARRDGTPVVPTETAARSPVDVSRKKKKKP